MATTVAKSDINPALYLFFNVCPMVELHHDWLGRYGLE